MNAYLTEGNVTEPYYCDWCDRFECVQEFYHGDMLLLELCAHCVKAQEKGTLS